jgi:pyruvate formate lyase activating enzyme
VTGYILRIDRGSACDGPGLRTTVVLKGCPLRCSWCDTPESHRIEPELAFREDRCIRCFECFDDCKLGAISETDGRPVADQGVCRWCGDCADGCSTDARLQVGSVMTESRVLQEIDRDTMLHQQSGGGVTFSGGEPLLQAEFLLRLLEGCRALGIHSAVDTCGAAAPYDVERVADAADLLLYDLKHLDDATHRRITGASNREILENLRRAVGRRAEVRVRFTLVPGVNDDPAHVQDVAGLLASLGLSELDVLPYSPIDAGRYEALGRPVPSAGLAEPGSSAIAAVCAAMAARGIRTAVVERRVARR